MLPAVKLMYKVAKSGNEGPVFRVAGLMKQRLLIIRGLPAIRRPPDAAVRALVVVASSS